jgi:hypothetical protein
MIGSMPLSFAALAAKARGALSPLPRTCTRSLHIRSN